MTRQPFVVIVTLRVKPEHIDEFVVNMNAVIDTMRQEETFVNTVVHRSKDDAGLIMLYETWLDREDFMTTQLARPYRAHHEARMRDMLAAPREMSFWTPVRGDFVFQNGPTQSIVK